MSNFRVSDSNINLLYHPVDERKVFVPNLEGELLESKRSKALFTRNTELAIVGQKYQVVLNKDLIDQLTSTLEKTGMKYYIDPTHSWGSDKRMRLQLTLPELQLNDNESKIPLSLFVNNSYDGSEGIRILWGAIRSICSNGMVFGKVLKSFYRKHTLSFDKDAMMKQFDNAYRKIPEINERIKLLEQEVFTQEQYDETVKIMKPEVMKVIEKRTEVKYKDMVNIVSAWYVINLLTNYTSHKATLQQQQVLQQRISRLANL